MGGGGATPDPFWGAVEVCQTWGGCVGPVVAKVPMAAYDERMTLAAMAEWSAATSATFLAAVDSAHAAGLLDAGRRVEQVFHLVTHGTHHRTQLITMRRLFGVDPPFEAGDFGGWSRRR